MIIGQVFFILKEWPESRESDGVLLLKWVQQFKGVQSMAGLELLAKDGQFTFESVRRARQKIQHAGYFLPTDQTVITRRRLQDVWEIVFGQQT